jgi:hypothetical protein
MAVQATVFCQRISRFDLVARYYKETGHEPTKSGLIAVDGNSIVYFNTFVGLLEALIAHRKSHVVIVCHGTPEYGMEIPIAPETNRNIGPQMYALLYMVRQLKNGGPIDAGLLKETASLSGLTQDRFKKLADLCFKIRNAPDIAVVAHIRGCEIGRTADSGGPFVVETLSHIQRVRDIWNSSEVTAPTAPMFFGSVSPYYPRDVIKFADSNPVRGRRWIYNKKGERAGIGMFLFDINDSKASNPLGAVAEKADIARWAKIFHQTTVTTATTSIVFAGLWPIPPDGSVDYHLAHEPGYRGRLKSTKG